jgi:ABC-2 type transport system ATP-binding protein
MNTSDPAIAVTGLRKAYRSTTVLDGLDFTVGRGEIFALLGPNGAGKTTTVAILTTLLAADGGTVTIAGHDLARHPARVRDSIGLTGQYAAVDGFLSGEENLLMMCRLAHLSRRDARARTARLLEQFDLVAAAKRVASTYSGGMRRRLDLAISLIAEPPVVFLDEPTTGLDPRSRAQMWDVVRDLAARGTTILLTTQYLEEADQLADRIAVLDAGVLVAEGTAEQLKAGVSGDHIELAFDDEASLAAARELPLGDQARFDDQARSVRVPTIDPVQTIGRMLDLAAQSGLSISNISIIKPTLDDVFLSLTGHGTAEGTAAGRPARDSAARDNSAQDSTDAEEAAA